MRRVTYSMGMSLDGYVVGPDGGFDFSEPDEEAFRYYLDELKGVDVHLMGRRLYETMLYWETHDDDPSWTDDMREWAVRWRALPKVVFSTTLTEVVGNTRLLTGGLAEEIERLRDEPGDGDIAIGGPTLATAAAGLVDEYRPRVHQVLVGGGLPYFPHDERREQVELLGTRTFASGLLALRYRAVRPPRG